jgi:hypothetical protein
MLGMVLLDLCKLFPEAEKRKLYHAEAAKGKFPELVANYHPEEIALFKAMAIDQAFSSIRKLRESKLWALFR